MEKKLKKLIVASHGFDVFDDIWRFSTKICLVEHNIEGLCFKEEEGIHLLYESPQRLPG